MALTSRSLFLYGFEITDNNKYLDFQISGGGPELTATLDIGFYSLTGLLNAIKSKMEAADPTNLYSASADRTVNSGLENRVTISTTGGYLDLLFSSGVHTATSIASLIGFPGTDETGATSYTGTASAGTAVVSTLEGYSYLGPEFSRKVFGSVNISASGDKEALVFQIQQFLEVTFKYEPEDYVVSDWVPFFNWAIEQKPFDFTPQIEAPGTAYDVTMESTQSDSLALGYRITEMLPTHPFLYTTGPLKMRRREV